MRSVLYIEQRKTVAKVTHSVSERPHNERPRPTRAVRYNAGRTTERTPRTRAVGCSVDDTGRGISGIPLVHEGPEKPLRTGIGHINATHEVVARHLQVKKARGNKQPKRAGGPATQNNGGHIMKVRKATTEERKEMVRAIHSEKNMDPWFAVKTQDFDESSDLLFSIANSKVEKETVVLGLYQGEIWAKYEKA